MAYPTPEGIGEAAVVPEWRGIQFMLAVQMELLKDYEEVSVRSEIVVQACRKVVGKRHPRALGPRRAVSMLFPLLHDRFMQRVKGARTRF